MSSPLWIVVSAPSGAGKTTLVKKLLGKHPAFGFSTSVTTRPPRAGEKNGREYHFVSEKEFLRLRKTGKLLEWAKIHGFYYGTPAAPLKSKKNGRLFFSTSTGRGRGRLKNFSRGRFWFLYSPPAGGR